MTFDKAELITDKFFTLIAAICIAAVICGSPSAEANTNTNANAGLLEQASSEEKSFLSGLPDVDPLPLPASASGAF